MAVSTWDSLRHETGPDGEMSHESRVRLSDRVHLGDNVRLEKVKEGEDQVKQGARILHLICSNKNSNNIVLTERESDRLIDWRDTEGDRDGIGCQTEVVFVMESKLERQTVPASHHSASNEQQEAGRSS